MIYAERVCAMPLGRTRVLSDGDRRSRRRFRFLADNPQCTHPPPPHGLSPLSLSLSLSLLASTKFVFEAGRSQRTDRACARARARKTAHRIRAGTNIINASAAAADRLFVVCGSAETVLSCCLPAARSDARAFHIRFNSVVLVLVCLLLAVCAA